MKPSQVSSLPKDFAEEEKILKSRRLPSVDFNSLANGPSEEESKSPYSHHHSNEVIFSADNDIVPA